MRGACLAASSFQTQGQLLQHQLLRYLRSSFYEDYQCKQLYGKLKHSRAYQSCALELFAAVQRVSILEQAYIVCKSYEMLTYKPECKHVQLLAGAGVQASTKGLLQAHTPVASLSMRWRAKLSCPSASL